MVLQQQGLILALSGTIAGLALGMAASRLVGSILISTFTKVSPALYLPIMLPLVIVALLAAYAPARRASLIDPMKALREE